MAREIRFFALVISALLLPSLATAQAPPPNELGGVNSSRPTTMSTEWGGSTSWGT